MTELCIICNRQADHLHHLMPGKGARQMFDEIKIPVCSFCHDKIHANNQALTLSRMLGQALWEIKYMEEMYKLSTGEGIEAEAREEFRKKNMRSYL